MKERPILFSAPMVRAILNGTKTQTRRPYKIRKHPDTGCEMAASELVRELQHVIDRICPYGQRGDRLWVRETFCPIYPQDPTYNGGEPIEYDYAATYRRGDRLGDSLDIKKVWKPSIHMPRAACRIVLEVTGARVERLNSIGDCDSRAEGVTIEDRHMNGYCAGQFLPPSVRAYRELWEQINGTGSWDTNPWVWAIEFRRISA